jgi:hypothetical protein
MHAVNTRRGFVLKARVFYAWFQDVADSKRDIEQTLQEKIESLELRLADEMQMRLQILSSTAIEFDSFEECFIGLEREIERMCVQLEDIQAVFVQVISKLIASVEGNIRNVEWKFSLRKSKMYNSVSEITAEIGKLVQEMMKLNRSNAQQIISVHAKSVGDNRTHNIQLFYVQKRSKALVKCHLHQAFVDWIDSAIISKKLCFATRRNTAVFANRLLRQAFCDWNDNAQSSKKQSLAM